jgi:TP901 family phage tail tape measure protein
MTGTGQVEASAAKVSGSVEEMGAATTAASGKAGKSVETLAQKWSGAGATMTKTGKSLTKYVSLPLLAIGAASIKMSMDFQRSMLMVSTQAGGSAKEVEKLSHEILKLSEAGRFAQGPQELSEALFHIESAGFRGAKAMKTLKAASDLATVGNADLEATTNALVGSMKSGIKGAGNMHEAIGILNAAIGAGNLRMEDLNGAIGTGFLTSAKGVGLTLKDATAALGELTSQAIPANSAATRLRMTFTLMAAPTEKAQKALGSIGIDSEGLAKKMRGPEGLVSALELLKEHMQGLSKIQQTALLSEAFGGAKSGGTIVALLGNLDDVKKKFHEITAGADGFNKKLRETNAEESVKLEKVWSGLRAELIELGNEILPEVGPLLKEIGGDVVGLFKAFNGLPDVTKSWLTKIALVGIALGPILTIGGNLLKLFGGVAKYAKQAAVSFGLISAEQVAGGAGAGAAAGATGLTAAGGGAAAGGAVEVAGLSTLATIALPVGLGIGLAALTAAVMNTGSAFDDAHAKFNETAKDLTDRSIPAWKRSTEALKALHGEAENVERNAGLTALERHRQWGLTGTLVPHHAEETGQVNADREKAMAPVREAEQAFTTIMATIRVDQLAGIHRLMTDLHHGLAEASSAWKEGTKPWRVHVVEAMEGTIASIRAGMHNGSITADKGRKEINRLLDKIGLVKGSDPLGLAAGFVTSFKQGNAVTESGIREIVADFRQMPKGAREQAQEAVLGMAAAWAKGHPKIEHQVDVLRLNLETKFGQTKKAGLRAFHKLTSGVETDFGGMADSVGTSAEAIQSTVNSMLGQLNVNKALNFEIKHGTFKSIGIPGEAAGGLTRVPGKGKQDTVPLFLNGGLNAMVAPGEELAVINRHQRPMLDHAVASTYPGTRGLGDFFGRNNRPHYMARGGLTEPHIGGSGPLHSIGQAAVHEMYAGAAAFVRKLGGDKSYAAIVKNANRMDGLQQPYLWGGGHGSTASVGGPWDCSGAISELFNGAGWNFAPMVSGGFESFGSPGKGKVSVLASADHVYSVIGGRAFGTSDSNPGGGAGWINEYTYRPGFTTRHADLVNLIAPKGKRGKGQHQKKGFAGGGILAMSSGGPVPPKGGELVGASYYGGPTDHVSGTVGAAGVPLAGTSSFAELAMGHALGGLPFHTKFKFSRAGHSVVAEKLDIGAGGGDVAGKNRAVDFWFETGAKLGITSANGLGVVRVEPADGASTAAGAKTPATPKFVSTRYPTYGYGVHDPKHGPASFVGQLTGHGKGFVATAKLSFGALPSNLIACRKELEERQKQLREYQGAYRMHKDAATRKDLQVNINLLRARIKALIKQQARLVKQRREKQTEHRIEKRGVMKGWEDRLDLRERTYNEASDHAEKLMALEPEQFDAGYNEAESGAFTGILGTELSWRNTIIEAEHAAVKRERETEEQIGSIEGLKKSKPAAYRAQKYRLGPLRTTLENLRALYNPRTKLGGFEDKLTDVQGLGKTHALLTSLSPVPSADGFSGDIFQTQMTIRELGLKAAGPHEGEGEADAAKLAAEEERNRKLSAELAVERAQRPVLADYLGPYKTGGVLPADGFYMGHKGETVVPADASGAAVENHVHISGDLAPYLDVAVEQRLTRVARKAGMSRATPSAPGRRASLTGRNAR